jgi:hypothetical protein
VTLFAIVGMHEFIDVGADRGNCVNFSNVSGSCEIVSLDDDLVGLYGSNDAKLDSS